MDVPTLLKRFDATLDWLTAVTPEDAHDDDESQSFYSSCRPTQFVSRRRLRQRCDEESPRIRIIHERIAKPVDEIIVGVNLQHCVSDMTFIDQEVVDQEDNKYVSQLTRKMERNKFTTTKRSRLNRTIERPWTPDSSSTPSSSVDLHNKYISTKRRPCTNQSCRESGWCGLKNSPRRFQRSAPSGSSRRKDYDVSFIRDAIALISAFQEDSRRNVPSENQMDHIVHRHHPVRLKSTHNHAEECENRQERLRQRRQKRLSVSIDLPNTNPVYSRRNTPNETSQTKSLNSKRVSDHIRKFGESMDPNSGLGIFACELQNSLCTSTSENEPGGLDKACNAEHMLEMVVGTANDSGLNDTLLNDEICAHLRGTLSTAVDGVNAYFHQHSAVESGRPSSPSLMPEASEEMRWSMTHSQIEDIWGDEDSMIRLKTVVSSDDRREGKETFVVASPKSKREQPPQYPSTYFDDVKIKDIPFVQGMDVTVAPTCYIATPVDTPQTGAETKLCESLSHVSSADTRTSTPHDQQADTRTKCPSQDETSSKIENQASCSHLPSDGANGNTSPQWSPGFCLQFYAKRLLSRKVTGSNGEGASKCSNRDHDKNDSKTVISSQNSNRGNKSDSRNVIKSESTQPKKQRDLQEQSRVDALIYTDDLGKSGSCVMKTDLSQNVPETTVLQDCSASDISCSVNKSALDAPNSSLFDTVDIEFASRRGERAPGFSSGPSGASVNRRICDSQENPSDLWDGEIEFFGHASASLRRQRNASNKYASRALQELAQHLSGEPKDNVSCKMSDVKLPDLTQVLSPLSNADRSVDSLQLKQAANEPKNEERIIEEVSPHLDKTPVCANNLTGGDTQDSERIEVVHVEESFDQGDFFQSGGTNGIIFAAFNADCVDKDFSQRGGEGGKNDNDATNYCNDICSATEARCLEIYSEQDTDDASEKTTFDGDENPATFLGVIPGKRRILNQSERSSRDDLKIKAADHDTHFTSATTGVTFEAPARKAESEFPTFHPAAIKLQSTLSEDAKHLAEQAALSLAQPNASASSVLFFKPTINVFGGESGANELAALTRAFSRVPDVSSGKSNREKSHRTSFGIDLEAETESKAQQCFQETYCDNDDDSFTRELSRLAMSERLLREELESFQRKHSKASEAKNIATIIDLSMLDDSYCAASNTTSKWRWNAGSSRYGSTTEQSTRVGYNSDRMMDSASVGGFTSRLNRGTRIRSLGCSTKRSYPRRLSSPTRSYYSQPLENELQRAPTAAGTRNEDAPDKYCIQHIPRTIDSMRCRDELRTYENAYVSDTTPSTRADSRLSLLRSRLDQKRSALRSAIDMQRVATQVEPIGQGQKQEAIYVESADSRLPCRMPDESIEQTRQGSENKLVEGSKPEDFTVNSLKVAGSSSSSNSSKLPAFLVIDDPLPARLSNFFPLSARLPNSTYSSSEIDSAVRNCSDSEDYTMRAPNFGEDDQLECPQIEVALSPTSLEFTTGMGLTFKGVELCSFRSYSTLDAFPDVSIDGSEREKEVEVTLSPKGKEHESDAEREKSSFAGSKSSSYITLSDDSSNFRLYASDGSRQLSKHIIPPGLVSSNSTTSSLSFREHLPAFALREESSDSLSSRLSLPSIDSSKAEQILVSYREAQQYRDSQSDRCPVRLAPSKSASSASRQRLVRFDLPLILEPRVSNSISSDIDDRDAYFPGNDDVSIAPFATSLSEGRKTFITSETRADPPGSLEKDPDDYLRGEGMAETKIEAKLSPSRTSKISSFSIALSKRGKKRELCSEKKTCSKPLELKHPPKAPKQIQISVPSKNIYLDKLKSSKDLRKSLLLGHKKKSQLTL